ncbi:ribosome maturation factor RimM [uncultured Eubacterium sp.]|uniref:ribosome maturation factor RimM n=1 Tax=uncultured Eubacterium sp. TaxID=165185 RepID=UPI0025943B30|nr:ribosome maturation factor RimM [uncultured Eubacterium sp.]
MEELFRVGVISNTHGIRGEVKVYPTTDNVRRFDDLKEVILDTGKEQLNLHVTSVKHFKNMVILKFKEFDNINDIIPYKGMDLLVTRENAIPLEEGEYYIADIIGSKVITDEDKILGTLTDVLQTGANDVYVVKTKDGKEVLLPSIEECVLDRDIENKIVKVHIMKGLLD